MNKLFVAILAVAVISMLETCKRKQEGKVYTDTYNSGTLKFVSDESFSPIVDEEVYIFKNDNPEANPQIVYRPENGAVNMLLSDSVRFAFLSRDLTPQERNVLAQRNLPATVNKFAEDAIAVIVNQASADTGITVGEIKRMLTGQSQSNRSVVFDNPNSSLVRYLKQLAGVQSFTAKNIYALKTNKEVIRYVSEHPEAIGITGFSWVDDPDADYADAVKKVKILSVRDENSKTVPNQYFAPSQSTLALGQYPLRRGLYMVNCTGRKGLGTGLELFIAGYKGQRIILRSGLLPFKIPERNIVIIHRDKL
ncbi:MAG: substrate-binding domain-containing protein [Bacteroidetes bacterium]|nr:substrate-binding domain-containing protein [Bacteroidota bacterium]